MTAMVLAKTYLLRWAGQVRSALYPAECCSPANRLQGMTPLVSNGYAVLTALGWPGFPSSVSSSLLPRMLSGSSLALQVKRTEGT
jgi:hypothetical protein